MIRPCERRARPGRASSSVGGVRQVGSGRSGRGPAVAVGPRAEVARRVERAAAERAGRPAGRDDRLRRACERPGQRRRAAAPASTSSGSGSSIVRRRACSRPRRPLASVQREDLDHDALVVGVPGQRHRADAELLVDRLLQRARCRRAPTGGDRRDRASRVRRLRITSSSSSSIRSASTDTCCFSSATLVTRAPARACRKKVRCPGSPTVPRRTARAGRSGGSTGAMAPSLCGGAPRAGAAADGRVAGVAGAALAAACVAGGTRRDEVARVGVAGVSTNGRSGGVADHRDRAGSTTIRWNWSRCMPSASARIALITSPWLTASQTASAPCSASTRGVPRADGGDGARRHLGHRLAAGERARRTGAPARSSRAAPWRAS